MKKLLGKRFSKALAITILVGVLMSVTAMGTFALGISGPLTRHEMTFISDGGSTVSTIKNIIHGDLAYRPENPVREGYEFAGWYLNRKYLKTWNFDTDRIYQGETVYAKWNKLPEEVKPNPDMGRY